MLPLLADSAMPFSRRAEWHGLSNPSANNKWTPCRACRHGVHVGALGLDIVTDSGKGPNSPDLSLSPSPLARLPAGPFSLYALDIPRILAQGHRFYHWPVLSA